MITLDNKINLIKFIDLSNKTCSKLNKIVKNLLGGFVISMNCNDMKEVDEIAMGNKKIVVEHYVPNFLKEDGKEARLRAEQELFEIFKK